MNDAPANEISSAKTRRFGWPFWFSLFAVAGFIFFLLIPNLVKPRCGTDQNACIANLKQIDGGIQQWALENKKSSTETPAVSEVAAYLKGNQFPVCPGGGTYTIHSVSEDPTCNVKGHTL